MKIYIVYKIDRDSNILSFEKAFRNKDLAYEYSYTAQLELPLDRALNVKELEVEWWKLLDCMTTLEKKK